MRNGPIKKVLHVIPSISAADGGPSVQLRVLTDGLNQAGIEVHVATTDDGSAGVPYGQPIVRDGITWWHFRRQTSFYKFSWPMNLWLARRAADYDIVHIHALFSFAPAAAAYWAHQNHTPYVIRPLGVLNEWGMENRRPWLKRLSFHLLERRILENAAWVHFTSEQEYREASGLGIRVSSRIIPNPVPRTIEARRGRFRARHPELRDRRIVLFLSRFDRKKGLDLLLPAFAQVRRDFPAAALVLAGSGDTALVASLRDSAQQLGIAADVFWPGFIDGDEKQEAFADADVFVLPSYSENFGIAAAEALAAGCPVIVSDQVAIHTDITAAAAGIVVPCDIGAIAQAIRGVLTDSQSRGFMVSNGRRLADSSYSIESVTRKVLSAYANIGDAVRAA
jgi:glycosyltransferase involved in cell wall biosynthesis